MNIEIWADGYYATYPYTKDGIALAKQFLDTIEKARRRKG